MATLETLLRERQPGYSLAQPFYTSPEIFETDLDVIFGRHWIYVGVEPDVPEPGDAMLADIGRHSVIIVRHDDMSVRAFHNVCRHRGARLIDEPKTSIGNLVCRYHQWTYNLDGELIYAAHMEEGFDRSCRGLRPVHIRSLAGLLFVCVAEKAPDDFDAVAAALTPYIARHDLANAKVIRQIDLIEQGNWKLTMENNRECYHCAGGHPELTISLFEHGFGFAPDPNDAEKQAAACRYDALSTSMKAEWEKSGFPSAELEHLDDTATGYRTERLPLDGAGESQTLDTKAACSKLLGSITNRRLGGLSVWTQPNSWHHFMADHVVTFAAFPISPDRTLLRTKWLVHKDAVEGRDYAPDNVSAVWRATNEQDGAFVGYTQAGVRSSGYTPGPYSTYTEGLVEKFASWYIKRLSAHLLEG